MFIGLKASPLRTPTGLFQRDRYQVLRFKAKHNPSQFILTKYSEAVFFIDTRGQTSVGSAMAMGLVSVLCNTYAVLLQGKQRFSKSMSGIYGFLSLKTDPWEIA